MIRKAELRDLQELKEIYNEAILHTTATFDTETKDDADRLRWFEEHEKDPYVILVEEMDGAVAGYASLSCYRERKAFDATVEVSIYIGPVYRGKGIGDKLMKAILAEAEGNPRIHTVVSLITGENDRSIALHKKHGFEYCGSLSKVGYKFDHWLDLNIYQLFFENRNEVPYVQDLENR